MPRRSIPLREALPGASLVWIETPSDPGLAVLDVAALADAAHAAGAALAVDNTLATPLLQRPLELGADIAIAGPLETWLAHRSLATLDVRHERQCANALTLARALQERPDVHDVRDPGLPSDPGHGLATRVFGGGRYGSVLCFDLETEQRAQAFLLGCRLVAEATSFGGVHISAEPRLRWGIDDVAPGFVRLSAGIEDPDDLVADVAAALDGAAATA